MCIRDRYGAIIQSIYLWIMAPYHSLLHSEDVNQKTKKNVTAVLSIQWVWNVCFSWSCSRIRFFFWSGRNSLIDICYDKMNMRPHRLRVHWTHGLIRHRSTSRSPSRAKKNHYYLIGQCTCLLAERSALFAWLPHGLMSHCISWLNPRPSA